MNALKGRDIKGYIFPSRTNSSQGEDKPIVVLRQNICPALTGQAGLVGICPQGDVLS